MKNLPLSFLFSWLLSSLSIPVVCNAQTASDSIEQYYQLIVNPQTSIDIPEGIMFYSQKKENDLKRKDTLSAVRDLRLIAIGQAKIGNLYDSENATVEALALIDKYHYKDTLIEAKKGIYNEMGNLYRESYNTKKAIEAYNLSLSFSRKLSDSLTLINNKSNIYKDLGQYQKAAEQLNLAYVKIRNDTNSLQSAMVLDNLGYVQSKLGNPDALLNLKKALSIRDTQNNLEGIYSSNKHLAMYYFDRNDKQLSQSYSNKAYQTAQLLNSITYLQDALSLFAIMNDDPKIIQFKKITDSIAKDKQLAENKNAYLKYNVAKEKKKTSEALLEREMEKNQKLIFIILGIIIFLTSIFIYLIQRVKYKKEKILQVHNTETRISKKVHDEVANDVYHLMAKIQGNAPDNEELLDELEKIYNKTRDISKENSAMEIQENFSGQLNDLLLSYQTEKVKIATRNISKIDWSTISETKKTTIYRILQELMTNMKKHSNANVVVLSFQQNNKKINIEYTDNGKGCEIKNKNGLQNAENRIKTLNGTINFESKPNGGFKAKITL
ncbi:tetratricopeptide repeat-containing sensor histidine kinase [Aequorivita antarctica]|uniref:histidine kinase n=1 Tax=Aequorivita antarctica TaxID=153266 RepID=A0A5C6Z2A0_9FLAO|nr:tetratricopeptide repeat-containing sensor histidine kinase [Aequorivita antarctica]TXD73825.1 ATP-binding protein [Aequorivita antarctica]SRX73461.1 Sensor histidine kinase ComP [Aequorivita antarctica]